MAGNSRYTDSTVTCTTGTESGFFERGYFPVGGGLLFKKEVEQPRWVSAKLNIFLASKSTFWTF